MCSIVLVAQNALQRFTAARTAAFDRRRRLTAEIAVSEAHTRGRLRGFASKDAVSRPANFCALIAIFRRSRPSRVGDALLREARLCRSGELLLLRRRVAGGFRVFLTLGEKALHRCPSELLFISLGFACRCLRRSGERPDSCCRALTGTRRLYLFPAKPRCEPPTRPAQR